MGTTYQHLQPEDRITLASLRAQGYCIRAVSLSIKRLPRTISREVGVQQVLQCIAPPWRTQFL